MTTTTDLQTALDAAARLAVAVQTLNDPPPEVKAAADTLRGALLASRSRTTPGDALAEQAGLLLGALETEPMTKAVWTRTSYLQRSLEQYRAALPDRVADFQTLQRLQSDGSTLGLHGKVHKLWSDVAGALREVADDKLEAVDANRLARHVLQGLGWALGISELPERSLGQDVVDSAVERATVEVEARVRKEIAEHPEQLVDGDGVRVLDAAVSAAIAVHQDGQRAQLIAALDELAEHIGQGEWLDGTLVADDGSELGPWRAPTDDLGGKRISWQIVRDRAAQTVTVFSHVFQVATAATGPSPDRVPGSGATGPAVMAHVGGLNPDGPGAEQQPGERVDNPQHGTASNDQVRWAAFEGSTVGYGREGREHCHACGVPIRLEKIQDTSEATGVRWDWVNAIGQPVASCDAVTQAQYQASAGA